MQWLTQEREPPYELAHFESPGDNYLTPANAKSEDLIMEFLEIDQKKLEQERRAMVEECDA